MLLCLTGFLWPEKRDKDTLTVDLYDDPVTSESLCVVNIPTTEPPNVPYPLKKRFGL